jgi:hypothetical protein
MEFALGAHDVDAMMILLKVARIASASGQPKQDTWTGTTYYGL